MQFDCVFRAYVDQLVSAPPIQLMEMLARQDSNESQGNHQHHHQQQHQYQQHYHQNGKEWSGGGGGGTQWL
jgi:hypothetical protein